MTTTVTETTSKHRQSKPKIFKRVINYLQSQAVSYSEAVTYLTPPGQEPQQRIRGKHYSDTSARDLVSSTADGAIATERSVTTHPSASNSRCDTTMTPSRGASVSQAVKRIQYANENLLQSYEVFVPDAASLARDPGARGEGYWMLYIHGGYFRDPKVDATAFRPALELMTDLSPSIVEESESNSNLSSQDFFATQRHIAGYASINYRLAPHVQYPQNPSETPKYEMRQEKSPEQMEDIYAALKHLQSKHRFGSNYILSGHSVGATLAFMAALGAESQNLDPPKCVVGLNGIYDFPDIHRTNPAYEPVTKNAMKPEEYALASPALVSVEEYVRLVKQGTTNFLLSHSRDDGLVVWDQVDRMNAVLKQAKSHSLSQAGVACQVGLLETKGQHDVIWKEGKELARTIKEAVDMVLS